MPLARVYMAHLVQVGAGSGGMPVLDMLSRDPRITRITLIEPDIYKTHNVERHLFARDGIGKPKVELARDWIAARRPELSIDLLPEDLLDPSAQPAIDKAVASADLGVCAADNDSAKYHWDSLMRRHGKPWTLGEVLSGGIGGFVHCFLPGQACYGCVASHLQRSVEVDEGKAPDYSQPSAAVQETTIPATRASIEVIAALHAHITLSLLDTPPSDPGFTSLLFTLQRVPGVFEEALRPFRFRISRANDCLICRTDPNPVKGEGLDAALEHALQRLGS